MIDHQLAPPKNNELELTVIGSGYGESVVLHLGNGDWLIVDSFTDAKNRPVALRYLDEIGVKPSDSVALCVTTHWHDDHIRGLSELVASCSGANYCCPASMTRREILEMVGALKSHRRASSGTVAKEIYITFSQLRNEERKPIYAMADRLIFQNQVSHVWALSPSDSTFQSFVTQSLKSRSDQERSGLDLLANETAITLWIDCGNCSILLGSDLERQGWLEILESPKHYVRNKASAFKIPHHGSRTANVLEVWQQLVEEDAEAVVTPWRKGGRSLPSKTDIAIILEYPNRTWLTSSGTNNPASMADFPTEFAKPSRLSQRIRLDKRELDLVRLRKFRGNSPWRVETFGSACKLSDYIIE